jgi:hypothetical protein
MSTKSENHIPHPAQPYENSSRLPLKDILFNNFLGGMSWALGATIGLSIIFAALGIIAKNINFVPIVGSFASQVVDFVLAHNPSLQK